MTRLKPILLLFGMLLICYMLFRLVFALLYFGFGQFTWGEFMHALYWGLRIDYASLFYINLPFLVYYFFPNPFLSRHWSWRISLILFSLTNIPFLALNVIDLVYYKFNLRRSTVDIFYSLPASMHSFGSLFIQYWFVLVSFILLSVIFVWLAGRILRNVDHSRPRRWKQWIPAAAFLLISGLVARGWSSRPIVPSTPLLYFHPTLQPFVNNSTFNFLYSYKRSRSNLDRKNYFPEHVLDSVFSIRRHYRQDSAFNRRNVVVFLLESFSESFLQGPSKAQTPFFDSIRGKSLVCSSAFQNGHESVKGILSTLASIPPFLDEPMFLSNYNSVPFDGIGSLLKKEGYETNFFLGAEYDHFNFAKLCRMIGIENYYSADTYGHDEHDDGVWGLYDEYFFPYFADVNSRSKQPFFSVLFNISSHPPFTIPATRKKQFTITGQTPQQNAISYVDDCFRQLFQGISKEEWFSNTLFLFIADHTLLDNDQHRSYMYRSMHIPFFIYDPRRPMHREVVKPVQQLDLVPTILDLLHYPAPFMSFGSSVLRDGEGYSISRAFGAYQLIDSGTITGFDERTEKVLYHYNRRTDPELAHDLSKDSSAEMLRNVDRIRGVLQRYHNSLIDHRLLIRE